MKVSWAKWEAPPRSVRRLLPDSYFLLPGSKKFPYREWKGRNRGAINCNALKVAIPRAVMSNHPTAYRLARKLYNKYCAGKKR